MTGTACRKSNMSGDGLCQTSLFSTPTHSNALVLSSPSALSTKLATKQQLLENMTCRQRLFCQHNNVLFKKRKDTFEKQNIDKISLQKGLTVCEKSAVKRVQRHA